MNHRAFSRRSFLQRSFLAAAAAPLTSSLPWSSVFAGETSASHRAAAKVAIAACLTYDPKTVRQALDHCFHLLGGIGSLVKNKTVAVKINLTGTDFSPFLGLPTCETFMTHYSTALALAGALFDAGAKRVRLLESPASKASLEDLLTKGKWDLQALSALGKVEYESTRNLGQGSRYSHFKVPGGGYMFSSFEFNHAYEETDVMVSLCKLKNHLTAGITLSMKNLFGLPPNTMYGGKTGEDATDVRAPLHDPHGFEKLRLPGLKEGTFSTDPKWRVPRITVDICAARPVHLAVIDGITAMSGGEGPWCAHDVKLKPTSPGVLIAGFNMVSTDAVGTAVMGYDPRARGVRPFESCENHLVLAEQVGLGTADLSKIDVRGLTIENVRYPYG